MEVRPAKSTWIARLKGEYWLSGNQMKEVLKAISEMEKRALELACANWGDKPTSKRKKVDFSYLSEPFLRILEKYIHLEKDQR